MSFLNTVRHPLRAIWDIKGYPTESLIWPAKKNENKVVLFFIPGNPGLVEYYTSFFQAIYDRSESPHLEIIGVSHKGHSVNYPEETAKDQTLYSLKDQIQHKIDCFDILRKENRPETKFVLVGHSIGAYISAEVLKKRPKFNIERVIALFPTLRDIGATPNGLYISKLVNWVPNICFGAAGSLISWLSPPVRQFLVKITTGQTGPGLQVTAHQLLHSSVLKNVVTMAKFEMDEVKGLDHDFYSQNLEKFIVYYSENDQWAPRDHYDYLVKHFETVDIHLCELNIPHAFCLDPVHVDYMANKVKEWVQKDLP